jgi:DNA-binding SARP family transcriptional activator/tetratricopeptide (TPR) repeat protein
MTAPWLDVALLGQARVQIGSTPVKFAKRTITLAMLTYLILQRDRAVRETLAFTLFPELTESEAFKELRRYLYLAHKALGEEGSWIQADTETVRWNASAPARIDIVEFERLARSPATLAEAVDVYAGDLLPEIYDDWIVAERERLRALFLTSLSTLIGRARSARDFGPAIRYAQRLLVHDPWREDVVRALIAARYESGDAAGALAEYERFAASTRAELAAEPMAETRALRDLVVRGAPLPSALDRALTEGRAPRPAGLPFAGREREFERLRHAWERAVRAKGGVVAIEGEPGIGKSRLAAEFVLAAESEGARVLAGTTSFPEMIPYQCVIEVLRAGLPLIERSRADTLRMQILGQILPELQSAEAGRARPPEVEGERGQSRLFDAVGATLVSLARTRPLCIVAEDLHWAGRGTLELLRALAHRAASAAILLIFTLRDEEVGAEHPLRVLLRDLAAEGLAVRVPLGRLTRLDIERVVATFAQTSPAKLDAGVLFAESEGNPLFLNEAVREALEPGAASGDFAPGLHTIIERRLERLSTETRRIAAVAAVCGNAFDADVVCSAAGASGAPGLAAIEELLERQIVRETAGAGGFAFAFGHHLICAALYASLGPAERTLRHARVARALERFHHRNLDSIAAEIARHHTAAGEYAAGATWYSRAARAASAIFAHDEAVRFAGLALEHSAGRDERIRLLLLRETANGRLGRRADQLRDLDRLDTEADAPSEMCESLRRRVEVLHALDDRDAERDAVAALRAHAAQTGDPHWLGVAACAQAWLEVSLGRYAAAEPLAREAVDRLAGTGDHSERLEALAALVEIDMATGRPEAVEATLLEAQSLAGEARDDRGLAAVLMQAASASVAGQQFDRALAVSERAAELYRSLGDVVGEARALVNVAAAAVRQSRWEAARSANLRAAATFALAGDTRGSARVFMNLAMLHGRCGAIDEGRRYLLLAREHQRRLQDDRAITASLLNESFLALWQRRPSEAQALATQALERAQRMNHVSYRAAALANLGAAERDLGLIDEALAHMEEGLAQQLQLGRLPDAVSDLADVALAHAMRGDLDRSGEHVERILLIDRAWTNAAIFPPFPPWVAARILHARGDKRAQPILAWAAQLARDFSASIDVPELAASFLALPFVADIGAAAAHDLWPALEIATARRRHASGTAG